MLMSASGEEMELLKTKCAGPAYHMKNMTEVEESSELQEGYTPE